MLTKPISILLALTPHCCLYSWTRAEVDTLGQDSYLVHCWVTTLALNGDLALQASCASLLLSGFC